MHASPRDGVILFLILFQVAAVAAMLALRGPGRRAGRVLAGLFLTNAVIATILWLNFPLRQEVGLSVAEATLAASRSLDLFTLYLIGALAPLALADPRSERTVPWMLGVGAALAVLTWVPAMTPGLGLPGWSVLVSAGEVLLTWHVALFNLAVAVVILVLSRGPGWARWVALALAPRVLYWAVFGLDALSRGLSSHPPHLAADLTQAIAGLLVLLAMGGVLREELGPSTPVTIATLLVGPVVGLAQVIEIASPEGTGGAVLQILNLATLGLVRPLVATLGLARERLARLGAHAAASAATAFLLLLGGGTLLGAGTQLTAALFALAGGVVVLVVLEGLRSSSQAAPVGARVPVQPGDVVADRYVVREPLGQGATGVTVAARDRRGGREVALKILHPEAAPDMAERERRAIQHLDHPHVVVCYDVHASPWGTVLVLERVRGPTLEDRLAEGPLDPVVVGQLGEELLGALVAVHKAGLLHRDIKPSNLLLDGDAGLKLTDFNVARVPDLDATLSADQPAAVPVGTLRYMAPEVARGLPAGWAADLYSAGAVLFEALSGEPYVARQPGEGAAHLRDRVARLGAFDRPAESHGLSAFFTRALHPQEDARFTSATDMLAAWRSALPPRD